VLEVTGKLNSSIIYDMSEEWWNVSDDASQHS